VQRIGQTVYSQTAGPASPTGPTDATGPTGPNGPADQPDSGTVEGQFREV